MKRFCLALAFVFAIFLAPYAGAPPVHAASVYTQNNPNQGRNVAGFLGDSLTHNIAGYSGQGSTRAFTYDQKWPALVQNEVNSAGGSMIALNCGRAGDTSGQMLQRAGCMTYYVRPLRIATFYPTTINDTGHPTTVNGSGATTTVIPLQTGAGQWVPAGSYVFIGGVSVQIASVATDTITLATALASAPASGTAVTIDTYGNTMAMVGAVINAQAAMQGVVVPTGQSLTATVAAMQAAGAIIPKITIVGRHYDNWASGGDTPTTQGTAEAAARVIQQNAVTAINAVPGLQAIYVNLYTYMAALITNGPYTQGDSGWHDFVGDVHLDYVTPTGLPGGEQILRDAVFLAWKNAGWLSLLSN